MDLDGLARPYILQKARQSQYIWHTSFVWVCQFQRCVPEMRQSQIGLLRVLLVSLTCRQKRLGYTWKNIFSVGELIVTSPNSRPSSISKCFGIVPTWQWSWPNTNKGGTPVTFSFLLIYPKTTRNPVGTRPKAEAPASTNVGGTPKAFCKPITSPLMVIDVI